MSITRTDFTRQYDHVAVIAHGAHPEYRLEFDAPVDATNGVGINQGSVISLNSSGAYILGCPASGTAKNHPVPFISLKNVRDPDVTTGINGSTYLTQTRSAVGGKITAIPCTAGYELETTEFADGTYAVNDGVVAGVGGSPSATGLLTVATAAPGTTEVYCGFVSIPPAAVATYGHSRLSFFTHFIPAKFATGAAGEDGAPGAAGVSVQDIADAYAEWKVANSTGTFELYMASLVS